MDQKIFRTFQEKLQNISSVLSKHGQTCGDMEHLKSLKQEFENIEATARTLIESSKETDLLRGMVSTLRKENKKLRESLEASDGNQGDRVSEEGYQVLLQENKYLKERVDALSQENKTMASQAESSKREKQAPQSEPGFAILDEEERREKLEARKEEVKKLNVSSETMVLPLKEEKKAMHKLKKLYKESKD